MDIRLLVLRTGDTKRLADFYSLLGLTFDYHQHGQGPFHYSAVIGLTVLEIYPLTKSQAEADKHMRLGLGIEQFEKTVRHLKESRVPFSQEPAQTDFGFMAVIADPDGRKIELYKNS